MVEDYRILERQFALPFAARGFCPRLMWLHVSLLFLSVGVSQEVDFLRAQQYADSIGAVCIETSAKTNVHVHDAFVDIGASGVRPPSLPNNQ